MAAPSFSELDGGDVEAEVVLLRAASQKTVLILEGGDDKKVYSRYIDQEKCEVVISYGRANALGGVDRLSKRNVLGILAMVDADYDQILGVNHANDNVFVTDERDLEVILIRSPALDKVLAEFGSPKKLATCEARQEICRAGTAIGALRVHSLINDLGLDFNDISFDFIDRRTLVVNIERMIKVVLDKTRLSGAVRREIERVAPVEIERTRDDWRLCSGHDLAAIIGKGLQMRFGSLAAVLSKPENVEAQLRLAYEAEHFKSTQLYLSIRGWERRNSPFLCLRIDL